MVARKLVLSAQLGDSDVRLLRIFRAVVDCGGISAAEVELNMSVAAISMGIADLERRLSLKLCQRGRAGFALSDEGAQVYEAVLQVLAALEDFRTEVNSLHANLRGELNIGITDNLVTMSEHMRVTHSLAALRERGPDVRINIRMLPPPEIEKSVLDGRMHIGVIPSLRLLAGLEYLDLYTEESRLYCGHEHPLYCRRDATEQEVLAAPAVLATGVVMPEAARTFSQQMQAAATATDREGIAFLILSGRYIGFLPRHYAQRWVAEERMRELIPEHFLFQTPFAAITRKGARPNLVLQTYLEELRRSESDQLHP
ncbi:LysR family transcriptional regulator [Halieaceae bacterium IMCC14734]|uniref:LysR family transcriptional regulator n=1 Tax=Candidatus Litorirhabdus singularis TaxID=2518993 RepID=A0ABT3TFJ7_9GAMM|nr:LysR family transcriptional regulator [Candidatus Litorirhabdus singularis]MCX2981085.1 LysR family transcriptional regulator [Candidatus Litorirhabdus singularis]